MTLRNKSNCTSYHTVLPPGSWHANCCRCNNRLYCTMAYTSYYSLHRFHPMFDLHFQDTISVHRPGFYATRFQNFYASRVFKKIPSCKYGSSSSSPPAASVSALLYSRMIPCSADKLTASILARFEALIFCSFCENPTLEYI